MKLWSEKLWDLDCDEDTGEKEDNGVSEGGNENAGIPEELERLNKVESSQGCRIDASEVEVFLLDVRAVMLDTASEVASLWSEEDVEHELDAVDDCHEPVNPAVGQVLCNKSYFTC